MKGLFYEEFKYGNLILILASTQKVDHRIEKVKVYMYDLHTWPEAMFSLQAILGKFVLKCHTVSYTTCHFRPPLYHIGLFYGE